MKYTLFSVCIKLFLQQAVESLSRTTIVKKEISVFIRILLKKLLKNYIKDPQRRHCNSPIYQQYVIKVRLKQMFSSFQPLAPSKTPIIIYLFF